MARVAKKAKRVVSKKSNIKLTAKAKVKANVKVKAKAKIQAKKKVAAPAKAISTGKILRQIEKLEKVIAKEQAQLGKLYAKSVVIIGKTEKKLTAQLEKLNKRSIAGAKPARGRKPAKNAANVLQEQLAGVQKDSQGLAEAYEKFLATQQAVVAFEKSWKKKPAVVKKEKKASKIKQKAVKTSIDEEYRKPAQSDVVLQEQETVEVL